MTGTRAVPLCDGVRRPVLRLAALFVTLFALTSNCSFGQTLYGSLTGNVSDSSGAAVPNAKVEALNLDKGTIKSTTTDERGSYLMGDLLPGTYKVSISAPSFSSRVQEGVAISVNTVIRLDANLTVSQINESVTVSAAAVTLQTDRADINNQIQSSQITNLPLINSQGRNFQVLFKVLPGFTPPVEVHSESGNPQRSMATQANGMPQSSNNTKLDGATISHPWLPRLVAYLPPVEAVETVIFRHLAFAAVQPEVAKDPRAHQLEQVRERGFVLVSQEPLHGFLFVQDQCGCRAYSHSVHPAAGTVRNRDAGVARSVCERQKLLRRDRVGRGVVRHRSWG